MVTYKEMSAFARHYPAFEIVPSRTFLSRYSRFLLVDEGPHRSWSERRLENNPAYRIQLLGPTAGGRLYLVERQGVGPGIH